jgi:predicted metal-dependent phosphoesterase TrpH
MIIDLHTHTHYSADGKLTIPELLDYYSPGDIVGITDHETIGGWDEFKTEAEKRNIRPILGVEWFAGEHHILCYFLRGVPDNFYRYMKMRRKKEKECMEHVFTILQQKYPHLGSYDAFIKSNPHPEKILSVAALAATISAISKIHFKEAVYNIRKIRGNLPKDQQQETFFANEIIDKINSWGAVSILAHPYYEKDYHLENRDVEKKIRVFVGYGIQGVEVLSGKIEEGTQSFLLSICGELSILPSIGSDFHFEHQNEIREIRGNIGIARKDLGKGLNPSHLKSIDPKLKQRVEIWLKNLS